MADPSRRDLARIGATLGETDGELFKTALRGFSSARAAFGTDRFIEFVAGQVWARASDGQPADAQEYVETFAAVYDLDELEDVDDLLGRESFERRNYAGQLAFARSGK